MKDKKVRVLPKREALTYGDLYGRHRYYQTILAPELGYLLEPILKAFYERYNDKINIVTVKRMELQAAWLVMDETQENKVPKIDDETKDIIMLEGKKLEDYKAAHKAFMQTEFL